MVEPFILPNLSYCSLVSYSALLSLPWFSHLLCLSHVRLEHSLHLFHEDGRRVISHGNVRVVHVHLTRDWTSAPPGHVFAHEIVYKRNTLMLSKKNDVTSPQRIYSLGRQGFLPSSSSKFASRWATNQTRCDPEDCPKYHP